MTLISKVLDISKINTSFKDEGARDEILCDEHHPLEKGYFKTIMRAFSNSIKLGLRGNLGPKDTGIIFQSDDTPHDLTLEELKRQPVFIAISWFVLGLIITFLLICITLLLTSRYSDEKEDYVAEAVPSRNSNDEEMQLPPVTWLSST
ncbi:hypothetical protein SMKI_15G3300 [Saccharomyces mikatae IFO 1815]|uniref:YOR186W-like protein n=1 Tax=Saccharomyces mikatae IFO 1815 TaxID=226126 RepID=A0AA35IUS1_SACMI|nr:uncharacterized protein SMKI_15G3300 [Saccharomyces mikatae IFO 1815]CAI4036483.1 hypothetical protein SMKI_15G3300 [Saccharomyces mikatae IFO 1815]